MNFVSFSERENFFCILNQFFCRNIWNLKRNPYLCNVFFIVLDLRLTRLGAGVHPFFVLCPC